MKKKVTAMMVTVMLIIMVISPTVMAAEPQKGIYDIQIMDGVSAGVEVNGIENSTATISGTEYDDFYANAEKVTLQYDAANENEQYVVFLIEDGEEPTEEDLVYIDQLQASGSSVSFNVYPMRLENGKTYNMYLSGETLAYTKVAQFRYTTKAGEGSSDFLAEEIGHNLNLSGSIGFNYFLHLSDRVLEDEGAKVHFDLPNGLTSEVPVKGAKVVDVLGIECREFGCKLHSSQMTGIVKAKVILSDGTESEEFPYTIKAYADIVIKNESGNASFTKVTPLIKAMLNYGGYAQQYFKYDDNPLANEDLTEEERNAIQTVTAEDVKDFERVVTGSQEGLKYEGSNLMLTSETCIRHFFTVQSGHDISEYTFKLDGKKLTPVKSGKMYYVEIPNIASGNLDKTYTVKAGGITIKYSAMSYVYTQLGKTDLDPDLANTLKALYLYNQEANLYYNR